MLADYPRAMREGPTANLVSDKLVACYENRCEIYNGGHQVHKDLPQQCSKQRRQNPPNWRKCLKEYRVDLCGWISLPAGAF